MAKEKDGKLFTSQSLAVVSKDQLAEKDKDLLYSRKLHKICAVWDSVYYQTHYSPQQKMKQDRAMWREPRQNLNYYEGFYLFGGMDDRNVVHNDLWLIRPDYYFNKDALSLSDTDFVGDYQLGMCLSKIEDFSGMPPCPRTQF